MDGRLVGLWRLHVVQISACVRRLRHKRHFFKEKRTAALVDDGVAQNDGVADDVHFGGYGQRLADSKAEVPAVQGAVVTRSSEGGSRGDGCALSVFLFFQAFLVRCLQCYYVRLVAAATRASALCKVAWAADTHTY